MSEKSVGQAVDRFLDDRDDAANTRKLNDWISNDPTHASTAFRRFLLHVLLEQHYIQQRMRRRLGMAD